MDGPGHNHGVIPVGAPKGTLLYLVLVNLQRWIMRWESGTLPLNIPSPPLAHPPTSMEESAITY